MKRLFLVAVLLFAAASALAQTPWAVIDNDKPMPPAEIKSFDPIAIDKTADPCTDFYQFACGNWLKKNPIPSDQTRWVRSFSLLQERNRYLLWQELDAAAKDPKTPLQRQYGDFYAACMNTGLVEKNGLAPLESAFRQIGGLDSPQKVTRVMSELEAEGAPAPLFNFGVTQDEKDSSRQIAQISQAGLSMPDRDYYLVDNPHFQEIRKQYVEHVTQMFALAGDSPEKAAKEAGAVMEIETALAKASTSRTDLRQPENHYHIYTVADFQKLAPDFDFSVYFADVKIGSFDSLNVATPDFFKGLNELIAQQPVDAWQAYFRWHVIHSNASNLPKAFFDENFAFFGKILAGQQAPQPRWKECTALTDRALGEAVGQDWVKQNFPPAAKESMEKLVVSLDKALGDDIKTLPWMSENTKKAAEEKLALYRNKIGYPEKWRSYAGLKVERSDLIGNVERSTVFEREWNYGHLGKPVNEKEWGMTPPTVNAYYDPSMNDIN